MRKQTASWRGSAGAILVAGGLVACSHADGAGTEAGGDLAGTSWLAEDIGGRGVLDNARSTVDFGAGGAVGGDTACNRYRGQATLAGDRLAFGPLASTRRACPPAVMDQERRFLDALEATQRFALDGPFLLLKDADGRTLVKLTRVESRT